MNIPERKSAIDIEQDESGIDMNIDPDELTKEQLLENIRVSMRQALAGNVQPAREALAEIRSKHASNADTG